MAIDISILYFLTNRFIHNPILILTHLSEKNQMQYEIERTQVPITASRPLKTNENHLKEPR